MVKVLTFLFLAGLTALLIAFPGVILATVFGVPILAAVVRGIGVGLAPGRR